MFQPLKALHLKCNKTQRTTLWDLGMITTPQLRKWVTLVVHWQATRFIPLSPALKTTATGLSKCSSIWMQWSQHLHKDWNLSLTRVVLMRAMPTKMCLQCLKPNTMAKTSFRGKSLEDYSLLTTKKPSERKHSLVLTPLILILSASFPTWRLLENRWARKNFKRDFTKVKMAWTCVAILMAKTMWALFLQTNAWVASQIAWDEGRRRIMRCVWLRTPTVPWAAQGT